MKKYDLLRVRVNCMCVCRHEQKPMVEKATSRENPWVQRVERTIRKCCSVVVVVEKTNRIAIPRRHLLSRSHRPRRFARTLRLRRILRKYNIYKRILRALSTPTVCRVHTQTRARRRHSLGNECIERKNKILPETGEIFRIILSNRTIRSARAAAAETRIDFPFIFVGTAKRPCEYTYTSDVVFVGRVTRAYEPMTTSELRSHVRV